MKRRARKDKRIVKERSLLSGYLLTLASFMLLAIFPTLLFGGFDIILQESGPYLLFYIAYWVIVVAVILTVISKQKQKTFDQPMQELSKATKKVAEGDFSVYLAPRHTSDKYDYIDVMFQDVNKMVQDLGSLETLKSDFIASVSHEIKTPIATIQSYAKALKTQTLTKAERAEYITTIQESSEKLNNLVANILKLNRLENQTVELSVGSYDLCRQLSDCILSYESKLNAKNLTLEVDMDDRATIDADKNMLEIVWNNLLSNAIKFSRPGGTLTIKQTSTNGHVSVSIGDTGHGIGKEAAKHIFDKFYQEDSSHSNEGNGLGLSLVGKIIDLVDGTIEVQSTPGEGSTFTVKLPIYPTGQPL